MSAAGSAHLHAAAVVHPKASVTSSRIIPYASDVLAYKGGTTDNGSYSSERVLTPRNVNPTTFGKQFSDMVDGQVYAQPLYAKHVLVPGQGYHNITFVATENDSVYALDTNSATAGPNHDGVLWHIGFTNAANGVTAVPSDDVEVDDINPVIGITGTPVIDPSTGTLFVVTKVKQQATADSLPTYTQQIHAINVATGQETASTLIGSTTIEADGTYSNQTSVTAPGTGDSSYNGTVEFNALRQNQRSGLTLDKNIPGHPDGIVFVAFSSHGDINPYHGWLVGYDARTLQQYDVFITTPDGNFGAIWQGGAAPTVLTNGDLLVATGNGSFRNFATTTAPGATALGDAGTGLGYAGISNSIAVKFDATSPSSGFSQTGLYYNGDFPGAAPAAPDTALNLLGSGINFDQAANDTTGPHTFRATLAYDGSNLTETLADVTSGATYSHVYANVNIPQAVGGNSAYIGFGGGTDGRMSTQELQSWSYTGGGSTVDHSAGFTSNSDLTVNGNAMINGTAADLSTGEGEQAGTIFTNAMVNIAKFTTSFTFQMQPPRMSGGGGSSSSMMVSHIGNGLTFIIQAATGQVQQPDYSESVLRLTPSAGTMAVADTFTPFDYQTRNLNDQDFGSTEPMVLPRVRGVTNPHLAVMAGKEGKIFVLNTDNLGGYNPGGPNRVVQTISLPSGVKTFSPPAYANGTVYYQSASQPLMGYTLIRSRKTKLASLVAAGNTGITSDFPGTAPAVSSLGRGRGIVWSLQVDQFSTPGAAILRAFDARNLTKELYASSGTDQGASTVAGDTAGNAVKFTTPTIADGTVIAGTDGEVDFYGLRSRSRAR